MNYLLSYGIFIFILIQISAGARAETFRGPVSKAFAGAGRAGTQGMESAFVNPALIPLVKASEMSAVYEDGYLATGQHRNAWGVGVIDSEKEAYFPGALHYLRLRDTGRASGPVDGELWHLAVGRNLSDWLALGGSVYRIEYDVEGDRGYTQWNSSVGVLFLINEQMGVAYVLDNVAKPASRVPFGLREDLSQGLGVYGALADIVKIRADVSRRERFNPDHKLAYALAIESMTSQWMLFRAGFKRDEWADSRLWTAGFGFNGPRLRLNYGFEKNARGTGGAAHSVDIAVPF